jgi:hypothetical protein
MPWRSAEQLLAGIDDGGGEFGWVLPAWFTEKNLAHHRQTSEYGDDGAVSILRHGEAATYRCQAPDPDCQCNSCVKERAYKANPKLRPPAPKQPILVRVDSNGLRWYKCTRSGELVLR